jgi:hypothetical protein
MGVDVVALAARSRKVSHRQSRGWHGMAGAIPCHRRHFDLAVDGQTFRGVLLESAAPKTCDAFWRLLPFRGEVIHSAWVEHHSYILDRFPQLFEELGFEPEDEREEIEPGEFVWDPWIQEISWSYGSEAEARSPSIVYTEDGRMHRNRGCVFARVTEDLDAFADVCERLGNDRGAVIELRRAGSRAALGHAA